MWSAASLLIIMMVQTQTIAGKLTGDHICQEERRYIVNETQYFVKNSTVRSYKWCLNVPPRCSFYTNKAVNDSRIVEKEVTEVIETCCAGYAESQHGDNCIKICPECLNGTCEEGKCVCVSGFKGTSCNTECAPLEWGPSCKLKCTCERGTCHSVTGSCTCPSGWTGNQCESPCPSSLYGVNCKEVCNCEPQEVCHHVTGLCQVTTSISPIDLPHTMKEAFIVDVGTSTLAPTTTESSSTTLALHEKKPTKPYLSNKSKNNLFLIKNNGKFNPDNIQLNATTAQTDFSQPPVQLEVEDTLRQEINKSLTNVGNYKSPHELIAVGEQDRTDDFRDSEDRPYINTNTTDRPVEIIMKSSKAKVDEKEVSVTTGFQDENYLNDEAHRGTINHPAVSKNDLINSASAATAITIVIIIVAVAIVAINRFMKKKKKEEKLEQTSRGLSTVSVYTHSIFHTPLPEPPPFENPVFINPADGDSKKFETTVVCSMNFPTNLGKDPRDYLYDHPPSTGSYRAASIPEPPDVEAMSCVHSLMSVEPVYDEIPSGMIPTPVSQPPPSYKSSSSLYMNTCGKTRL